MSPRPETDPRDVTASRAAVSGVTELLARTGHDLIGPMNRAASLLALLSKRYRNQLDGEADRLLDFLFTSSQGMARVAAGVERYLEIAAAQPEFAEVDLNDSLAAALAALEKPIAESGAVIVPHPMPVIQGNNGHIATLFELAIGNSITFRRPDAAPRVEVSCSQHADSINIALTDNGIGIEPEFAEAVFIPFRRLNGADYPGLGLGLTIAKLIAEMHGGTIRIESLPEFGIRLHLRLPARSSR